MNAGRAGRAVVTGWGDVALGDNVGGPSTPTPSLTLSNLRAKEN